MKITSVQAIPFNIPYTEPLIWAAGRMDYAEHVLVRINTDEGIEGIAEGIPRKMIYGETQKSITEIVNNHFAPLLIGLDPFDLEKVWSKLGSIVWNPTAKGAIDVALYDIIGKKCGQPCYKLLGGWTDRVAISWMVAFKSMEEMIEEAKLKYAEGYKSFKLKGGIDPDFDIEMFSKIREALGKEARLYLDANQGYSLQDAVRVLSTLEYDMACCEEPLPAWDRYGRKKLAELVKVPLLGDESVFTVQEVAQQIELGALRMIMIKIPRTGYTLSRKIVALAETYNMPMCIGTQAESSLGTIACAHFAAAHKQISLPCELAYYQCIKDSLLKDPIIIEDGYMMVPQGPGLGVELDEEKVEKYRVE